MLMGRMHTNTISVIILAYFHRYGWIAAMMGCIGIWPAWMPYIFSISSILWSEIKKSEAYGIPLIFFVIGTALLIVTILR